MTVVTEMTLITLVTVVMEVTLVTRVTLSIVMMIKNVKTGSFIDITKKVLLVSNIQIYLNSSVHSLAV